MNALKRHLTEWFIGVLLYILAYLIVFGGTALSLYLWAAPLDDWGAAWSMLFWRSFAFSGPLGLILFVSWRGRRMRDRS